MTYMIVVNKVTMLDLLADTTGYQTCEMLYDFCIDAGVSATSCQEVYDECLLNQ